MNRIKLFAPFLVALLMVVGSPLRAGASLVPVSDVIVFNGQTPTGSLSCVPDEDGFPPAPLGCPTNASGDPQTGVPIMGGSGAFGFKAHDGAGNLADGTPETCQTVSDETVGTIPPVEGPLSCNIDVTAGSYKNLVAGTGSVAGTVTAVEDPAGLAPETTSCNFALTFIAGIGSLGGTCDEADSPPGHQGLIGVVLLGFDAQTQPAKNLAGCPAPGVPCWALFTKIQARGVAVITE